jgi:hypothetical protein
MPHDGSTMAEVVAAANGLTARWAATCGDGSVAMAGAGAWPVLALLAAAASGQGRQELQAAVGVDAAHADQAARAVLEVLGGSPGIQAALGLWNRQNLVLREEWLKTLPEGIRGELTGNPQIDQPRLDAWASEQTGARIPTLPRLARRTIGPETRPMVRE